MRSDSISNWPSQSPQGKRTALVHLLADELRATQISTSVSHDVSAIV